MHLTHLSLADFRCYREVELALESGCTTFLGANGQGKTNLVEAIGYLATQSSHRVATDAPLIRFGESRAVVRGLLAQDERTALIEIEIAAGRANRARVNRSPLTRARDALGIVRTVLFAPEDLSLIKGDPSERRRFLDDLLVQRAPRISAVRADYDRVVKQRNALLKTAHSGRFDPHTLEVWNQQLATQGAMVWEARLNLVSALAPLVTRAYATVAEGPATASIRYVAAAGQPESADRAELQQILLDAMAERRSEELARGLSLVGPHRDELALQLGEFPVKGYASHGESWSFALALRLASYDLLRSEGGEPVLLLDDVFAELDTGRRDRLAVLVEDAEQVLITAAVAEDVPSRLRGATVSVRAAEVHSDSGTK